MSDQKRKTTQQNGTTAMTINGLHRHTRNGSCSATAATTTKEHDQQQSPSIETGWRVMASEGSMNTTNPIREIIETMNLAENPNKKVIPLSIGDPTIFGNLKPCPEILDAIQKANQCGKFYGYQTAAGLESAREAVAGYHFRCTGNKVKPQDVILSSGCSHAIDLCICVLARHGQNILIPRPGFPLYKTLTSVYGVQYKQYNLLADKNWSVDLKHLESLIDENTTAIIVNNPSNPCGSVYSREHLLEILELAERHRLPIIADEIYDKFVFAPEPNTSRPEARMGSGSLAQLSAKTMSQRENIENRQPGNRRAQVKGAVGQPEEKMRPSKIPSMRGLRATADLVRQVNGDKKEATYISDNDEEEDKEEKGIEEEELEEVEVEIEEGLVAAIEQQFQYVPFISMAELSETVPILTCGGISKTCLIPGLRLGWIIINDKKNIFDPTIRQGLSRLTQRLMGPNSLIQGALQDILNNVPEHFYRQTMDFIFKNAKICYERLKLIRGLRPYMPQGSMYLMVKFDPKVFPTIQGDLDFTSKLMNEQSVLVLPGSCFDFPNFFRICLTVPSNVMEEALNRIEEFCQKQAIEKPSHHQVISRNLALSSFVTSSQAFDHRASIQTS
uniref:Tyrosine aminotransferase n=1 Tax=Aceria tosichella TaxID=561515 RepID=A0A6G1SJ96_9ACAR